ncbi:MAG: PAS domain S-box protein, partial [Gammaproteobacteria bacterium]|nr:PAS domain S-box protein [Gammaproteobacteria bacterium]NIR94109.1 PAS domain S-box protein [Gammaproteobacteria bacterium]NIW39934.1 PAS domain S-box protein [candidate division Zixibacteria bacterium]NIX59078.1 PAS domain S-box protein [candidate division Zixibacteria bacterium]
DTMRDILIAFMIVTIVTVTIMALLNIRQLMLPLTALGRRTGEIAEGHYEFQFRPSGFSEIDALAHQITNMSHAIKVREESIVTNEKRFRDLVNSIEGIVWEMDYPSFRYLFVSQQAETILGYPLQEWYEDHHFWANKTHVDDMAQARAYCQLMAEKHEDHDFEFRMIAADGRIVWIRNLVTVVVEHDRPVRLLGVMIDVTEQKQLLEELTRSEENYREIFNASSDAIFVHDADTGGIVDVNQSMLNMFHCTYEDALRAGMDDVSLGESPYSEREALEKIQKAKAEGSCKFEWRSRKFNGELFWAEVYLRSAIVGGNQRILAAVRDISI